MDQGLAPSFCSTLLAARFTSNCVCNHAVQIPLSMMFPQYPSQGSSKGNSKIALFQLTVCSKCRAHAADVLHTVHCTLYCGELVSSGFVSGLEVLACYIAAVVHDVEHPGTHPFSTDTV